MDARVEQLRADQRGFTLVELLVVILIITILAGIALAAFLGQRNRAQDAEAKAVVITAQKTLEDYYTDNRSYAGVTVAQLVAIEPSLTGAAGFAVAGTPDTYTVGVDSQSGLAGGGRFTVVRLASGRITRSCANAGRGSCPASGTW